MKKSLISVTVVLAAILLATVTASAQETKKVEKKMVMVTVQEGGIEKDTTFIESDTIVFDGGDLVIDTREGKKIIRKPGEGSRMVWVEKRDDFHPPAAGPGMRPARVMTRMLQEKEGVNYNISVDGVVVHITAPKEKAKEADQILTEVKKILMKK
ncbi:MAG: hypothetical protein RBT50_08490 [Bacteroidales bacterium]|jgi:hypothetical protein|nr:hypothetical protein [Bacteroidales bacterium]